MSDSNKKVNKIIREEVDDLFCNIANRCNLNSGDISPEQLIEVDKFKDLLKEYIEQNS